MNKYYIIIHIPSGETFFHWNGRLGDNGVLYCKEEFLDDETNAWKDCYIFTEEGIRNAKETFEDLISQGPEHIENYFQPNSSILFTSMDEILITEVQVDYDENTGRYKIRL